MYRLRLDGLNNKEVLQKIQLHIINKMSNSKQNLQCVQTLESLGHFDKPELEQALSSKETSEFNRASKLFRVIYNREDDVILNCLETLCNLPDHKKFSERVRNVFMRYYPDSIKQTSAGPKSFNNASQTEQLSTAVSGSQPYCIYLPKSETQHLKISTQSESEQYPKRKHTNCPTYLTAFCALVVVLVLLISNILLLDKVERMENQIRSSPKPETLNQLAASFRQLIFKLKRR